MTPGDPCNRMASLFMNGISLLPVRTIRPSQTFLFLLLKSFFSLSLCQSIDFLLVVFVLSSRPYALGFGYTLEFALIKGNDKKPKKKKIVNMRT